MARQRNRHKSPVGVFCNARHSNFCWRCVQMPQPQTHLACALILFQTAPSRATSVCAYTRAFLSLCYCVRVPCRLLRCGTDEHEYFRGLAQRKFNALLCNQISSVVFPLLRFKSQSKPSTHCRFFLRYFTVNVIPNEGLSHLPCPYLVRCSPLWQERRCKWATQ